MLSIFDHGAWPPCPTPFNMAAHVLARGEALPDKPALQLLRPTGAERWSYGRLIAAVRGAGSGLLALGLQPGDRVLLRLGNTPRFPVAYLGAIAAGLVPVATSAQATVAEITAMAAQVTPALILADEGIALPEPLPCRVLPAAEIPKWEALPPCDWSMGDPDRLAYIVFTSGTSGRAQAVGHAHRALWARGMMHRGWEGLEPTDRLLHAGAFNWTYTLGTGLLDPWTVGACALIPAEGVQTAQLPLLARRFDVTIFAAVPGIYRQILKSTLPALPRLRHGLSAGEKLSDTLRQAWRAATGTDLHEALGMSECSTYLSGSPDRPAPSGTAGYPQSGRRLALLAEDGQPVPIGEPGQIAVHRSDPGLFLGYVNDPSETARRYRGDWFLTGDMAVMAENHALTTLGRSDDMMNPGGYRVSPAEVEAALARFPGLTDLAVTEIEVKPGVRIVACFYVTQEGIDEAQLSEFAATQLSRYKQPRDYIRLPSLPRGANGKLNRRALAAMKDNTP